MGSKNLQLGANRLDSELILNTTEAKAKHIVSQLIDEGLLNDDSRNARIEALATIFTSDEGEFNDVLDQVGIMVIRARGEEGERREKEVPRVVRERYGDFWSRVSGQTRSTRLSDMPSEPPPAMG